MFFNEHIALVHCIIKNNDLSDSTIKALLNDPKYKNLTLEEQRAQLLVDQIKQIGINESLDLEGNSAYLLAAKFGRTECLKALYKEFPDLDLDYQAFDGTYALYAAVENKHLPAAIALCQQGAVVGKCKHHPLYSQPIPFSEIITPLMTAMDDDNIEMVELLLAHGAFIGDQKEFEAFLNDHKDHADKIRLAYCHFKLATQRELTHLNKEQKRDAAKQLEKKEALNDKICRVQLYETITAKPKPAPIKATPTLTKPKAEDKKHQPFSTALVLKLSILIPPTSFKKASSPKKGSVRFAAKCEDAKLGTATAALFAIYEKPKTPKLIAGRHSPIDARQTISPSPQLITSY